MVVALLKLVDSALRFLFVIAALYALPDESAGRFGLVNAMVAFFCFVAGIEAYWANQRRLAGADAHAAAAIIRSFSKLVLLNYAVSAPILAALSLLWLGLGWFETGCVIAVAVGEHVAIEAYRLALMLPQLRVALTISVARGLAVACALGAIMLAERQLTLDWVLAIWAIGSILGSALVVVVCRRIIATSPAAGIPASISFRDQYQAALIYFVIGLLALSSAQLDRFVVGVVAGFESAAIYFRHLFVIAGFYQLTTIAFLNPAIPKIYAARNVTHAGSASTLLATHVKRIVCIYAGAALVLVALSKLATRVLEGSLAALDSVYLTVLAAAFAMRSCADLNAVALNAARQERSVLAGHASAVAVSLVLSVVLTANFGIGGTIAGVAMGSATLLGISTWFLRREFARSLR